MSVRRIEAELVLDARATLGEGPSWDDERGELIWVDILEHAVHLYDPMRGRDRSFDAGQPVSAAVRRARGGIALAVRDGFALLDPASASVNLVVPVEADLAGNRMNDGKCDAGGRFIAGTMPFDGDRPTGALYRLDPDLGVTKLVDGVTISNGIGWSPDGRTMYYVDSPTHRVEAFDYDPQTGGIGARRTLISLPEEWGLPDGMTTDEAGFLWVAFWEGSAVRRLAPDGRLDAIVELPVTRVTSCCFGGRDLAELYVTSAAHGVPDEPHAGGLFRARPGVRGTRQHPFGG